MATKTALPGIVPDSWIVTILPLPKRFSRGAAHGFCNGHAVGRAETARAKSLACWWPDGKPELLGFDDHEYIGCGLAAGDLIPGYWMNDSSAMRAVAWRFRNGHLVSSLLHDNAYDSTWGTAAGGDAVIGVGTPPQTPGQRQLKVGLVWKEGAQPGVLSVANGIVAVFATDGTRVAGSVDGRAHFWPSVDAAPIDLSPKGMAMSEIQAIDGELQVGMAFKGFRARAGLWRGTADSFEDLTPKGFQTARALGATGGFQVGFVRVKDTTPNGSGGSDNRAAIWQGAAGRWFDLNALLPATKYNASTASGIHIRGDVLQVCGQATRYEATHPGTKYEDHAVPVAHPVIWSARLA
jgi:hypothetical protein